MQQQKNEVFHAAPDRTGLDQKNPQITWALLYRDFMFHSFCWRLLFICSALGGLLHRSNNAMQPTCSQVTSDPNHLISSWIQGKCHLTKTHTSQNSNFTWDVWPQNKFKEPIFPLVGPKWKIHALQWNLIVTVEQKIPGNNQLGWLYIQMCDFSGDFSATTAAKVPRDLHLITLFPLFHGGSP